MANVREASDTRETPRLISSEKVEGTSVVNPHGDDLGHIQEIMIDKISGRVGYAVLKYGSFLGMGGKLFALPWDQLKYDTQRDAYVVNLPEDRLKGGPSYDEGRPPDFDDPQWGKSVHDYYGSSVPWTIAP
jgi:sporulation protein YlmC with PRC-barrel domain